MSGIALKLGPLAVPGFKVSRSGLRWLCADGRRVRAHEIVAFCNIAMSGGAAKPFAEEAFDLQVAFAPTVAGRIRYAAEASRGGYIDRLPGGVWDPDLVWAHIEDVEGEADTPDVPALLFLAGRRFTEIAEDRSGLLTGWHDRARAWWGDGAGGTLLGAGICELDAILRGPIAFAEMFALAAGPAQIVLSQDEPLVPCAAVLAERLARSPDDVAAIRADMATGLTGDAGAQDWLFMGALLNGLERAPLTEAHDIVTRSGLARTKPVDAVCLSLTAELPRAARHRRLGYTLNLHNFRLAAAPPAVRCWLRASFEPFTRTAEDVARDYRTLIAALGDRPMFVVNALSSPAHERITSYRDLDDRTMRGLASVHAKTLNLMLHDLRQDFGVEIVDADAIAADMGMAAHLPDGVHGSGALYGEIREELVRLLRARGVTGFASRS